MKKANQRQASRLMIRSAISAVAVLLWIEPASSQPSAGKVFYATTEPQRLAPVAVSLPLRSLDISSQEAVFANTPGFFTADQFAGDFDDNIHPFVLDFVWNLQPEQDVGKASADLVVNNARVVDAWVGDDRIRIAKMWPHKGESLKRPLAGIVVFFAEGIGLHPFGNAQGATGRNETVLVQDNGYRCRQCVECDCLHSDEKLPLTCAHVNKKDQK